VDHLGGDRVDRGVLGQAASVPRELDEIDVHGWPPRDLRL
jgi:hypothetical protein